MNMPFIILAVTIFVLVLVWVFKREKHNKAGTDAYASDLPSTEFYTPSRIPYLGTADGAPKELIGGQILTDNGRYGFSFEALSSGSSRMYVKDLETSADVWAVTLPGT